MRVITLFLFSLLLSQCLVVNAQNELTPEEAQAQLLLDDVQNDIDELDGTHAARV